MQQHMQQWQQRRRRTRSLLEETPRAQHYMPILPFLRAHLRRHTIRLKLLVTMMCPMTSMMLHQHGIIIAMQLAMMQGMQMQIHTLVKARHAVPRCTIATIMYRAVAL